MDPARNASRKLQSSGTFTRFIHFNAVYFPNSRIYRGDTPAMFDYSYINRVYYAYATVCLDGGVILSDEFADGTASVDGNKGGLGSLLHIKLAVGYLNVVLSIGGPNASDIFPIVASSTISRDNFGRSALSLCEASGLDGIDIAWYPSTVQQGRDFLALIAAIRIHLPDNYFLSAMLPTDEAVLSLIDLRAAASYLDTINLAAYDFFGPWSECTGHHAQLYAMSSEEASGAAGVAYLIANGFPAEAILLGVPTHGRSFLEATGPGQPFRGWGGEDGTFEYNQLPRSGSHERVDERRIAAQCVDVDGGFVTYDNAETVKAKAEYCKSKGLGGLYYYNAPADSLDRSRSLIVAGFRELHREPKNG